MLSPERRKVLEAVCDTILPVTDAGGDSGGQLSATLERVEHLIDSLSDPGDRARLLALLETWAHSRLGIRRAGF